MSNTPTEELPRESPPAPVAPPDKPLYRRMELAANFAIVVVAVLLSAVLVKKFLLSESPAKQPTSTIKVGTQMTLPGVDWQESSKTALLFLSPRCGACTDDAPFYRQLAERSTIPGAPRMVTVFAGDMDSARQYLEELELPTTAVVRANPQETGVKSTPTLLVVDRSGKVVGSWRGKLPEEKQGEVFKHFPPDGQASLTASPVAPPG